MSRDLVMGRWWLRSLPGEPRTMVVGPALGEVSRGPERRRGTIGHANSLKHVRQMGLDGLLLDAELARDLLVGQALPDQLQHLPLPGRDTVARSFLRPALE